MLPEKIIEKIQNEIQQIDSLFIEYKPLLELSRNQEPELIGITALASVLHSFYTGIE